MTDPNKWYDFITAVWCKRATPTGLLACILCLTAAILPVLGLIEKLNQPFLPWWLSLFLPIMAVPLWFWWRKLPSRINSGKANIFLAPTCNSDCLEQIARLSCQLKREIRRRNLAGRARVWLLPTNHSVCSPQEATTLLERLGGGVVVFGEYKDGNHAEKRTRGFEKISFTLRPRQRIIGVQLSDAGQRALFEGRVFKIDEGNSFTAEEAVVRHIAEVSVFLVGATLLMSGAAEKSAALFADLSREIASGSNAFRNTLQDSMAISLLLAAQFFFEKNLSRHVSCRDYDDAATKCRDLLDRCKNVGRYTPPAWHTLDAIINFHFGRISESKETWNQLARNDCLGGGLSLGFLALWENSEREALDHYLSTLSCPYNAETVKSVLGFLGGVVLAAPGRPEFSWALGFVNDHFFDQARAIKDYKEFLPSGESAFPALAEYARERLRLLLPEEQDLAAGEKRMQKLQLAQDDLIRQQTKARGQNKRRRKSKRKRKRRQ